MVVRDPVLGVTDVAGVPRHIEGQFGETLDAIRDAAACASSGWPAQGARDGHEVRARLRAELTDSGLRDRLIPVLEAAVEVAGGRLGVTPVPRPPYVVVTSLGVLLRATLGERRLVVELAVYEHLDGRYRLRDDLVVSARLV